MPAQQTALQRVSLAVARAVRSRREQLSEGPLLVAVSGGPDSMALLLALLALPQTERPSLRAVHFSHGLRPRAEQREAALVERTAASWGVPLDRGSANVAHLAKENGQSVEEAARNARYAFLAQIARQQGAYAVALGHTLDDQAETVLLRLVRGAGLRGLGAMREWTEWRDPQSGTTVQLFRPMLHVSHQDTEAACAEAPILPARDASNRSLAFARNRVRLKVLPELERLNPAVRSALARFAAGAQADEELLRSLTRSALQDHEQIVGNVITWHRSSLQALVRPLLVRAFQLAWERVCGPRAALTQPHLEAMAALSTGPAGRELTLPHGMTFSVSYDKCRLGPPPTPETLPRTEVPLQVPGVSIVGPWLVEVQAHSYPSSATSQSPAHSSEWHAWHALLDADAVGSSMSVRGRRPGDRFHPLGLPDSKRLQDFYVDAKVPRRERDAVPLVVAPGGIVWVAGYRVAAWAAVGPATKRVLVISLVKAPMPEHSPGPM